jgi:hypothetical protein
MSAVGSVMAWAHRIHARRNAPAHQLLDLPASATPEAAQMAFHKVARIAHPDLHRHVLSPEDLQVLSTAYAIVAGAYQTIRSRPPGAAAAEEPASEPGPEPAAPEEAVDPAQAMSSKALLYYRKAEAAMQRGDWKSAKLQVKLALAQDPQSSFLQAALAKLK